MRPRGLEVLYSLNRLNVATSRARCLAVLVLASPAIVLVDAKTHRQMEFALGAGTVSPCAAGCPDHMTRLDSAAQRGRWARSGG